MLHILHQNVQKKLHFWSAKASLITNHVFTIIMIIPNIMIIMLSLVAPLSASWQSEERLRAAALLGIIQGKILINVLYYMTYCIIQGTSSSSPLSLSLSSS